MIDVRKMEAALIDYLRREEGVPVDSEGYLVCLNEERDEIHVDVRRMVERIADELA